MQKTNNAPVDTGKLDIRVPDMIVIPAGEFPMGTSDHHIQLLLEREEWAQEWYNTDMFQIEQPLHKVNLPAYEISHWPVTNAQYYQFIHTTAYRIPRGWVGFNYPLGWDDRPVVSVSWTDAMAYCEWLSEMTRTPFRLPTEAEWEKAARGDTGRIYPWGDVFDPWRCNTSESAKGGATPCGSYSDGGDSVYGVADMVGNVWELTSTLLAPYPYQAGDGREDPKATGKRVVRGGAWYYTRKLARCAAREGVLQDYVSPAMGFRVARSVSQLSSG